MLTQSIFVHVFHSTNSLSLYDAIDTQFYSRFNLISANLSSDPLYSIPILTIQFVLYDQFIILEAK